MIPVFYLHMKMKTDLLLGVFAKLQKKRLLTSSCLSICTSVRIEQLGSYRTDFYKILYVSVFRKYVRNIQVSLKLDKNNGYST
jgi:hypothetical protein